jgi:8-oxo-dGTP pyrophosphatase MutT (NUDIX family)
MPIVPYGSADPSIQWRESGAVARAPQRVKFMNVFSVRGMMSNEENFDAIWRPDVTVATIVPRDGRFLVVEETVRDELVLNQPAGHLEAGESLLDAAVRETLEETGWTVELTDLIGAYQWCAPDGQKQFLRFTFAATASSHDATRPLDAGIVRALWLTRDEIAAQRARLRSPMVLGNVDDWLAGVRFPLRAVQSLLDGGAAAR